MVSWPGTPWKSNVATGPAVTETARVGKLLPALAAPPCVTARATIRTATTATTATMTAVDRWADHHELLAGPGPPAAALEAMRRCCPPRPN